MKFTMFRSLFDHDKIESEHEWPAIVERAKAPREYRQKRDMPLIKFALFGDVRSPEGFLRNGANMQAITGVEGDYDAGRLAPEDACTNLGMAGVSALVYTTPSYSPEAPRWRVLAPLSADHPPEARMGLLGRVNGVLGGALAPESFVPAQSYYWGRVAGGSYLALEARGACVDTLPALDAGAVRPALVPVPATTGPPPTGDLLAEGGRNRGLYAFACRFRRYNASPAAILAAALAENSERCAPPLPEAEVRTIVRSALNHAPALDYVPTGDAPASVVVRRVEVVPTGLLVPRSVLQAEERRINALTDLPTLTHPVRSDIYHDSLWNAETVIHATLNGRLWFDQSTGLPMNGVRILSEVDAYFHTSTVNSLPGGHAIKDRTIHKAMVLVANQNPIDPWQDWLSGLQWDGVIRLDTLASTYFGVTVGDDGLENLMLRKLMVAVVARQFRPGAKFDAMLVLEGAQGIRKSSALRSLFGGPYVASWEHDFNTKDFRQQLQGNICIEVAELASFQRSEMNAIKSILSETVDVFRPSYGRSVERRPRRCVMIGTSNDSAYLTDADGNRRFWPMQCARLIDTDALEHDREQIFAESVVAFNRGGVDARWWELPGRVITEQAERMQVDPWLDILRSFLLGRQTCRLPQLMVRPLDIPVERQTSGTARRIAGLMRQLGWKRVHDDSGNYWTTRSDT